MKFILNGLFFVFIFLMASCHKPATSIKSTEQLNSGISDNELLDIVQKQTFNYFWDGAEPNSGLAPERIHMDNNYPQNDQAVVTIGGTGFGVMAIIAAVDRGFVDRKAGVARLTKIADFLEKADRFHGVWPHWLEGTSGKVKPFSKRDNGGDLVETAFLAQGLICVREYFKDGTQEERVLAQKADELWKGIDFDWYRNNTQNLYWHWSPEFQWQMNFPVHGFNECHIMYVLGAASPTHPISKAVYDHGWADKGKILKENQAAIFGVKLKANHQGETGNGGPLFWTHYSYLGLDPRGLEDQYLNYGEECKNQALLNYRWCVNNPLKYKGYGNNSWGLTSSYSVKGYAGHAPDLKRDLGVISPTAALSSIVYTPNESLAAMRYWYTQRADKLWGKYGFYDAFSDSAEWYLPHYLAIDQGPIPVMIENYRSGLLWKLFMNAPDVQAGLKKLEMKSPYLK